MLTHDPPGPCDGDSGKVVVGIRVYPGASAVSGGRGHSGEGGPDRWLTFCLDSFLASHDRMPRGFFRMPPPMCRIPRPICRMPPPNRRLTAPFFRMTQPFFSFLPPFYRGKEAFFTVLIASCLGQLLSRTDPSASVPVVRASSPPCIMHALVQPLHVACQVNIIGESWNFSTGPLSLFVYLFDPIPRCWPRQDSSSLLIDCFDFQLRPFAQDRDLTVAYNLGYI